MAEGLFDATERVRLADGAKGTVARVLVFRPPVLDERAPEGRRVAM